MRLKSFLVAALAAACFSPQLRADAWDDEKIRLVAEHRMAMLYTDLFRFAGDSAASWYFSVRVWACEWAYGVYFGESLPK